MVDTPQKIHKELQKEGRKSFEEVCLEEAILRDDSTAIEHWEFIIRHTPFMMVIPKKYESKLRESLRRK